jgi:hypothetical protein
MADVEAVAIPLSRVPGEESAAAKPDAGRGLEAVRAAARNFRMSDPDWQKVREPVCLPDKDLCLPDAARQDIESAIGLFLHFECIAPNPQRAKGALTRTRKMARALRACLEGFDVEAHVAMIRLTSQDDGLGGVPVQPSHPLREAERLRQILAAVVELDDRLGVAIARIPRRPTRERSNLDWLVEQLDGVLREHTGESVMRGQKKGTDWSRKFVVEVMRVANPETKIGPSSVDAAMKATIAKRARLK